MMCRLEWIKLNLLINFVVAASYLQSQSITQLITTQLAYVKSGQSYRVRCYRIILIPRYCNFGLKNDCPCCAMVIENFCYHHIYNILEESAQFWSNLTRIQDSLSQDPLVNRANKRHESTAAVWVLSCMALSADKIHSLDLLLPY